MTTGCWHVPWVRKIGNHEVLLGCVHFLDEQVCVGCFQSTVFPRVFCVEARKHWPQWEISNLPNANRLAGLFFHKFLLVLRVCQPTKVRRQPREKR